MLTDQEKLFVDFWEKNRDKEKQVLKKLALGLPIGLVFAFPILLSVLFRSWYKNMVYISGSQITIILIAVLAIAVFISLIRMKFKWENNEQLYKELKFKEGKLPDQ